MANRIADIDQVLERAFGLAYFIHGDKESARRIVVGAMAKLQVATAAQHKRLYYNPHGRLLPERSPSAALRSKVSFSELHLLQRLIYIESEPYEIQREQARGAKGLRHADLLVHFIKHLVRIGIKRNSFYVTLGLSRLLYTYSTAETMEIYNLVVQDPDRVKDDYYYRSRKGLLLHELTERFGNLLGTYRGPRGEARLQTENSSDRYSALVVKCLSLFVPWSTPCPVPENLDPVSEDISTLKHRASRSEDVTEVNRIHAVIHPGCLQRLILALGFNPPDERLAVPRFFLTQDEDDQDPPRSETYREPCFDETDLYSIKSALAELASRRRKAAPTILRILVDGTEHARLDLNRARRTSFHLKGMPELIEVRGLDDEGDILLASHLIAYDEGIPQFQPMRTSIITEGNQRISINVSMSQDVTGEVAVAQVEVKYDERSSFGTIAQFFRQLKERLADGIGYLGWPYAPGLKPVLFLILLAIVAGIVWYSWNRASREAPVQVTVDQGDKSSSQVKEPATSSPAQGAVQTTTPNAAKPKAPFTADKSGSSPQASTPQPQQERIVRRPPEGPPVTEPPGSTGERTRSPVGEPAVVSLQEVRKVYVESVGAEPLAGEVRRIVNEHLQASGRLSLTDIQNEADAVLKITVKSFGDTRSATGSNRISILAQLINARGEVVWPVQSRKSGVVHEGEPSAAVAQVVKNLLRDIQRLERKR